MKTYFSSVLFVCISLLFFSCGPKITTEIFKPHASIDPNSPIAVLGVYNPLPEKTLLVGKLKFGDTGMSTDCSFNSNCFKALNIARKQGANIVKITESKPPNLWTSCHRMEIELHHFKGDVETLDQITLQLD